MTKETKQASLGSRQVGVTRMRIIKPEPTRNHKQSSTISKIEPLSLRKMFQPFVKQIPKTMANLEDAKQLVRASGSVGANYIEANESLSKKDFVPRTKICRKEAKETRYWLRLIDTGDNSTLSNIETLSSRKQRN